MKVTRVKLSNVADNVNKDSFGIIDRNRPRWVFDQPIFASKFKVAKVTIPISYYGSIRSDDSTSSYFYRTSVPGTRYFITLQKAGLTNTTDTFNLLSFRFRQAMHQNASALANDDRFGFEYDEIIDRFILTITGDATSPSFAWSLFVGNQDLADILGVELNTTLNFTYSIGVVSRLLSYQFGNGPVIQAPLKDVTGDSQNHYPMPYSPDISGPNYLFLRSDSLNGFTDGGYSVGSGSYTSSNILASIEITQSFLSVQTTTLYDSSYQNISATKSGISSIDLYFTSEASRRRLNEANRLIDFNGQRWSVELEFISEN